MKATEESRMIHEDYQDDPSTTVDLQTAPLGELLVHTSMPTPAVAVKLCSDDFAEETGETVNQRRRDILGTFKRRAFNRISFKGESGPLLSR